ncbi:MAG: aminotransferase class V-fold PLP-dependent enzyme [Hyphomicrobiaceae bacterium]|nr:aminotransferase class V-fold PLP-dependent enzyme [Hyphomicrobiaceae bacterium]MCC0023540.1 aminotransferase class V-fold PLP-dependent enzyme [Hyphomicrobiaceae bacterium]
MTLVDRTYLDHCASAPLLPEARAAVVSALDVVGNASSVHGHGRAARALIEAARRQVASMAGATPKQVVFTSSASEAITQAIGAGAKALGCTDVVISAGEHKAVMRAADASGLRVSVIGLDADGRIDVAALAELLVAAEDRGPTFLVAVHAVNSETGIVQDMQRTGALVGASRHFLFVDAVQAFGKLPLDFAASAADMMAVSAHKIGGPQGVGALLMKAHCDDVRLIPGGGQEVGRRGGTEPLSLIAGFGAATEHFAVRLEAANAPALISEFEARLMEICPDAVIFGAQAKRSGFVSNFALPGHQHATSLMQLDLKGISVSSGSACSSGKVSRSHVLDAMHVAHDLSECALRVSVGWNSTHEDIARLISALEEILNLKGAKAPNRIRATA